MHAVHHRPDNPGIESGENDWSESWLRVLDIGGLIWESAPTSPTVDDALRAADAALVEILERFGEGQPGAFSTACGVTGIDG